MEDEIKKIKRTFRMSMNGIVSASMREKGMDYKINFGLTMPLIRKIADGIEPNAELAEKLWNENIRESKILATLIYPLELFSREKANLWVNQIKYTEIADQCCLNLFAKLPFSQEIALTWMNSENSIVVYTGLQLLTRLFIQKKPLNSPQEDTYISLCRKIINTENLIILTAIVNNLKRGLSLNKTLALKIIESIDSWEFANKKLKTEICRDITEEYDIYYTSDNPIE